VLPFPNDALVAVGEQSRVVPGCLGKLRPVLGVAVVMALFSVAACEKSAWTPMGSAEQVLSQIKLGGVASVARRVDSDESFGRSVMSGVATGDSLWLEVASKFTPGSATAEASLSIALASALPHSPGQSPRSSGREVSSRRSLRDSVSASRLGTRGELPRRCSRRSWASAGQPAHNDPGCVPGGSGHRAQRQAGANQPSLHRQEQAGVPSSAGEEAPQEATPARDPARDPSCDPSRHWFVRMTHRGPREIPCAPRASRN